MAMRSVVFEVVGGQITAITVDGESRLPKPEWTRDRMMAWLSQNGLEIARNPVLDNGTESHVYRKSLMGTVTNPDVQNSVRVYGA